MRDPYTILGVAKGADPQSVRKAYKKLAAAHHPDRNRHPQAAEQFKEIVAAYSVLTDQRERERYLRQRRREYDDQQAQQRRQAAEARRRAEAERSRAAAAAEQAFRDYARQVWQRRQSRQQASASADSTRQSHGRPASRRFAGVGWVDFFGAFAALLLMGVYVWRSASGLPLQPWLPGHLFITHPLHSPIWITLSLSLLMILQPRWFLMPLVIDGPRDVKLAGWAMFLLFPFISAGGPFLPYRLIGWL
jgi:DnaJ domain